MGSTTDNQKRKDLRKQLFSGESKNTPGKKLDEQEWLVPNWEVYVKLNFELPKVEKTREGSNDPVLGVEKTCEGSSILKLSRSGVEQTREGSNDPVFGFEKTHKVSSIFETILF